MPIRTARLLALLVLSVASFSLFPGRAHADLGGDIRYDADFLRSLQLRGGAIVSDVTRQRVEPYVGNYAAWGLARAARFTGDSAYLNSALRWLGWYQSRMDANGVVHDQRVVRGYPVPVKDEDSVDATSGVFLLAVREVARAVPESARPKVLDAFRPGIAKAVAAIEALRDSDGLTWAKPTWPVKYLMDNAEAYGGLLAADELGQLLGDQALTAAARDGASRARTGVASLWNPQTGAYDWAEHGDGFRQPANWDVLYPDAVEQAWAVAYGLVEPDRASALMARFLSAQPLWDRPTATATYWDGVPYPHPVGFWPVAGWALRAVGDDAGASAAAAHIRDGAWEINRQPPFTAGAQAQLLLLMTGGP